MKKYLTNNILLKIASVLFAIMLWLIVLNIDDPSTTRTINNIEVTVENAEAVTGLNKIYNIVSGEVASVSVTGPRSIVDKLSASDFVALADFKDLSQTNAVPITVDLKEQSYKDKVVISLKTNTMRLTIEDIEEKEFEVKVKNTGELAENYVIYDNKLSNSVVTVYAPTSVMNTIAGVVAEVSAEGESDDFTKEITLKCVNISGRSIDLEKNNVKIDNPVATVISTVYYSKTVDIKDNFENVIPDGYRITEKSISLNNVTIMGKRSDISAIDALIIPDNLLKIESNTKDYTITCYLSDILPEGAYLYGDKKEVTVNMHIDKLVERSFNIDVKKLALVNIPENYVASIVTKGTFNYTLVGLEDVLRNYQTQDAYNVSLEGLSTGTHKVKVSIDTGEDYSLLENVYVEVNLEEDLEDESTNNVNNETTQEPTTTAESTTEDTRRPTEDDETTTNIDDETTTEQ